MKLSHSVIFPASASSFFPSVYPDKDSNTPISSKTTDASARGRTRPRTLQLDQEDTKNTPTDSTQRKQQTRTSLGGNRKVTAPPTTKIGESKIKTSRVSAPNLHKLESAQESRRSSTGTNLSKSKSGSMNSLNAQKENKTSKDSHRPRSKWSTSKMASFASVPNLLAADDDEEFTVPPSNLEKSPSLSRSNPDLNDEEKDNNKPLKQNPKGNISEPTSPYKRRSVQPEKRSASTSRVSGGTAKALAEEKKVFRRVGASVSSLKNEKSADRDLMPPPAITSVAKTKPETKFVKRAQQARRKTTSDISLEEAKDILKGNSGILNGDKEKRKNSGVGSPTNVAPEVRPRSANDKEDVDMITDPKILNVASEIEKTAAEIRRQSGPQSQYSNLAVSPFEPPEHDISPERDIPNRNQDSAKYSVISKSSAHINVEIEPVSKVNKSISDNSLSRSPVSNSYEEEDYPSPSVKERIAKLNKKVTDVDQRNDASPYGDRLGSQSPILDMRLGNSPRVTTSAQFSFSQSKADLSSSQASSFTPTSVPIVTMATSAVTITTSSGSAPSRLSASMSKFGQQIPPIPFDPGNDIRQSDQDYVRPISYSAGSTTGKGASSYSLDSLGSQDSETLVHHLSPGSYHSPQSGTDTGIGSDLDTDCSNR